MKRQLHETDGVRLADDGVTREITVGIRYRARVKRHDIRDRVRSYPTRSALAFWAQSDTLDGLEEVRLGFGHRWDPDERDVGVTIISLRDGLEKNVIWAVEINSAAGGAGGTDITWTPVDPSLPQIDLYEARTDESGAT